jgi:hypothetical protein
MRRIGLGVIVAAMVGWLLATFTLPYYDAGEQVSEGLTYFDVLRGFGGEALVAGGAVVLACGGPVVVLGLAVAVLSPRRAALRTALVAAITTWVFLPLGTFLSLFPRDEPSPVDLGVGFWVLTSCALAAVIGAILMLLDRQPRVSTSAGI